MADKVLAYVLDEDGKTLLPVAVIYDKNGNDIAETYALKSDLGGITFSYDDEGYIVTDDMGGVNDNVDGDTDSGNGSGGGRYVEEVNGEDAAEVVVLP